VKNQELLTGLGIPHLDVILVEIFQLPPPRMFPECPMPTTIQELAQILNQTPESVREVLLMIRDKAMDMEIDVETLKSLMASDQPPLLLDVREPWEYDIAHLPGSLLLAELSFPDLLPQLQAANLVVTVCHHGVRSFSAAMYLKDQGVEQVRSLAGGVDAWAHKIDPTMARY
jgi:rhodanese-related sulfurtransferase